MARKSAAWFYLICETFAWITGLFRNDNGDLMQVFLQFIKETFNWWTRSHRFECVANDGMYNIFRNYEDLWRSLLRPSRIHIYKLITIDVDSRKARNQQTSVLILLFMCWKHSWNNIFQLRTKWLKHSACKYEFNLFTEASDWQTHLLLIMHCFC